MDEIKLTPDDFAEGVELPEPGVPIGWMVRDPAGKIVQWGDVTEAEMVSIAEE